MIKIREDVEETVNDYSKTGIYIYENLINGKKYTGQASKSFKKRFYKHKIDFKNGEESPHLQNSIIKYGKERFVVYIVEYIIKKPNESRKEFKKRLNVGEQYWMDLYETWNPDKGYNLCPVAGSCLGYKHTNEARQNISNSLKGRKFSLEHRQHLSEALKNSDKNPARNLEVQKKMSKIKKQQYENGELIPYWKGKQRSEDTKKKIGNAHRGKKLTEEHKEKIRKNAARGENHHSTKLLEAEAMQIVEEYNLGNTTQRKLARKYNVGKTTIARILKGDAWQVKAKNK